MAAATTTTLSPATAAAAAAANDANAAQQQSAEAPQPPTTSSPPPPSTLHISDKAALGEALRGPHPVLTHLNGDTTWLIHLPYPADDRGRRPPGRSHFHVLLDPWLSGPQSDVAGWFSTQEHVVPPSVESIARLDEVLGELERDVTGVAGEGEGDGRSSYIDVVAISHEFTDHCHEGTLRELPKNTPVFAPDKAVKLIRSWNHFDTVIEMPAFTGGSNWRETLAHDLLPSWLHIGRVVSPGNALYYHSAIMVAFPPPSDSPSAQGGDSGDAIVYSPHGINAADLAGLGTKSPSGLRVLALLHGMHDVRLATKQLNLGGVNGVAAARGLSTRYWITTHDEVKKGRGLIAPFLRRTKWALADAIKKGGPAGGGEQKDKGEKGEGDNADDEFQFVELGSGDGLVLA